MVLLLPGFMLKAVDNTMRTDNQVARYPLANFFIYGYVLIAMLCERTIGSYCDIR